MTPMDSNENSMTPTQRSEAWMTRPISLDRIELRIVRLGLVRPFVTALGTITERESLLVRIDGHDLTGWGECAAFATPWYSPETTGTAWQVIREFLVPALGSGQTTIHGMQRACARIRGHSMAKAAVACGADAIMIEVHPDPDSALSDGPQSLKPERFTALMHDLRLVAQAVGRYVAEPIPAETAVAVNGIGLGTLAMSKEQ